MSEERARSRSDEKREANDSGSVGAFGESSKARMSELLAMAMAYRSWSQRELAAFLGRDVHNLIPPSGVPKVDIVFRLAKALDWPPAAVLEDICGERPSVKASDEGAKEPADFRALNRAAYQAWLDGDFPRSVELALRMGAVASTQEERAEADRREAVAWNYLGRFQSSIEAANRGLARTGVPAILRAELRSNLAACYFALGQVHEGGGLCESLLRELDWLKLDPVQRIGLEADVLFVRAQCGLHRVDAEPDSAEWLARQARQDYAASAAKWETFAEVAGQPSFRGRAHMCEAGVVAADSVLGVLSAEAALERFDVELAKTIDVRTLPKGDPVEAIGWWALLGASVALRSSIASALRERYLAVFTNKAYEVADISGNWQLRERAFVIDYLRSRCLEEESTILFDSEDLRILAGAMGRFPAFRPMGWEMLRRAIRA